MYPRFVTHPKNKSFFLFGARGVGKTAWLKANFAECLYFDLLDSEVYTSFLAAPQRLAELIPKNYKDWVIIDEVQRVPELLNEVHRLIESRRLLFIMTGSSARKLRRKGVNLLAGRALTKQMHPLVAAELGIDFDLRNSLVHGCLPAVYSEDAPRAYLKSYVSSYLREEVLQEGLLRNLAAFTRFLEAASFSQGSVLNIANVARECAVSPKVVEDYFSILEDLLIAFRLPVFSKRAKRRMTSHPKFYFFDSGVYNSLRPRGPLDSNSQIDGAALETLFLHHLRAVNDYYDLDYQVFFWRTAAKIEVDFVLYGPRGLHAFELKLTDRLRADDLKPLELFQEDYPKAKTYLLYLGDKEWHQRGVEVRNFETAIRQLEKII